MILRVWIDNHATTTDSRRSKRHRLPIEAPWVLWVMLICNAITVHPKVCKLRCSSSRLRHLTKYPIGSHQIHFQLFKRSCNSQNSVSSRRFFAFNVGINPWLPSSSRTRLANPKNPILVPSFSGNIWWSTATTSNVLTLAYTCTTFLSNLHMRIYSSSPLRPTCIDYETQYFSLFKHNCAIVVSRTARRATIVRLSYFLAVHRCASYRLY